MTLLEKLKAWIQTVKQGLIYVITPLAFVVGYIWYLLAKEGSLERQLEKAKAETDLADIAAKQGVIDEKATQSDSSYESLRDQYLKDHPRKP